MNSQIDLALLHGGGQGSWVWDETITALRAQGSEMFGNILALDIPGCGRKRARRADDLDPHAVARELIDDLERAGMKNVVLVGHSLAGNVLPRLADLRPDLFRRLVYVSCSVPLPGQTVLQLIGNGLHGSNENEVGWPVDPRTTSMHDRYDAMFCNDMTAAQKQMFLAGLDQDHWPHTYFAATDFKFEQLGVVPATYVVCLQDRILPVTWQERFAERFHARRVVRIDAGHQVMTTRPHALAEVLRHEAGVIGPGDG